MKLLHIVSDHDNCIEEALVPIFDDYAKSDLDEVLDEVGGIVKNPTVEAVYIVDPTQGHLMYLSDRRVYYG